MNVHYCFIVFYIMINLSDKTQKILLISAKGGHLLVTVR